MIAVCYTYMPMARITPPPQEAHSPARTAYFDRGAELPARPFLAGALPAGQRHARPPGDLSGAVRLPPSADRGARARANQPRGGLDDPIETLEQKGNYSGHVMNSRYYSLRRSSQGFEIFETVPDRLARVRCLAGSGARRMLARSAALLARPPGAWTC